MISKNVLQAEARKYNGIWTGSWLPGILPSNLRILFTVYSLVAFKGVLGEAEVGRPFISEKMVSTRVGRKTLRNCFIRKRITFSKLWKTDENKGFFSLSEPEAAREIIRRAVFVVVRP